MRGVTKLISKDTWPPVSFLDMFVIYQCSNLGHMDGSDIRTAITLSGDNKLTKDCEEYQKCFSTRMTPV